MGNADTGIDAGKRCMAEEAACGVQGAGMQTPGYDGRGLRYVRGFGVGR